MKLPSTRILLLLLLLGFLISTSSTFIFSRKSKLELRKDTCTDMILIKGPVYDTQKFGKYLILLYLVYTLRFYLENSPETMCISFYITRQEWKPEYKVINSTSLEDYPTRLFLWVETAPKMNFGVRKRNLHRYKVAKNLELTRKYIPQAEWIVIIRSDWIMRNMSAIPEFKRMVLESRVSDVRGSGPQKHRLVTSHYSFLDAYGAEKRFQGSWTWLSDQWMFAHIDDAELYWGFNEYWTMQYPFSRRLQKVSDSRNRFLLTEAEFTQAYLRMLGREFFYSSFRKLLTERFIIVDANSYSMSWNYHLVHAFPSNSSDILGACNSYKFCSQDPNKKLQKKLQFSVTRSCLLRGTIYDCSVNTLPDGKDAGYYTDERDFYSPEEWSYSDPKIEQSFQDEFFS